MITAIDCNSLQPHELIQLHGEFPRSEYWSGEPFPSPGDLPKPGIESRSPALQVDSLPAELPGNPPPNVVKLY